MAQRGTPIVPVNQLRDVDLRSPRRALRLSALQFVVLDEADEMLDVGFAEDIDRWARRASQRRCCAHTMHRGG